MKRYFFLLLGVFSCSLVAVAGAGQVWSDDMLDVSAVKDERWSVHAFGVQVGTDIGGALPTDMEFIPKVFTPYPKLSVSLGAFGSVALARDWDLRLELNYKTVEMGADALVENQLAIVPIDGEEPLVQYFSGRAKMTMSFTMLEIPLCAGYTFPSGNNKILFGGYGAWVMSPFFDTTPQYGFNGSEPNQVGMTIKPGDPIPKEQTNFSPYMTKWDAGIVLGYERKIYKRINLGLRVIVGFNDIFKDDVFPNHDEYKKILEYNMTHMRGALTLSYSIFEVDAWWWDKKR